MKLGLGLGLAKMNPALFAVEEAAYILDTVTALNGYSLRKLKSTATKAVRVRRSSDNAEQDIGFIGEDLDESALTTFVGANDGFVTTLYNQVNDGTSENYVQSTQANQPLIVSSGVVIKKNTKAAIAHTNAVATQNLDIVRTFAQPFVMSMVSSVDDGATLYRPWRSQSDSGDYFRIFTAGSRWQMTMDFTSVTGATDTLVLDKLTNNWAYFNGATSSLDTDGTSIAGAVGVGDMVNPTIGQDCKMKFSELIMLSSEADKAALLANQNDYYSIV